MIEAILALVLSTIVLIGSPGPTPLALAAAGATFGIKKGLPFYFGNLIGLILVLAFASFGVVTLFDKFPSLESTLQLLGGIYICYLALKIATSPIIANQQLHNHVPKFRDGLILSMLNPKAYAAFLAIVSQFLLPITPAFLGIIVTALICLIFTAMIDFGWLWLGTLITPVMNNPIQGRILRSLFSVLMVFAVLWVFTV